MPLCEFEMNTLRMLAGQPQIGKDQVTGWGAALSVSIEHLESSGFITRETASTHTKYVIRPKGLEAIAGDPQ